MASDQSAAQTTPSLDSLQWQKFPVLDDGFVTLVDVMGNDSSIVQAARVSYGEGTRKVSDDRQLIRYLLRHAHTTPFEMAEVKFLVRVPMDCWRQWVRHRTANINEYSSSADKQWYVFLCVCFRCCHFNIFFSLSGITTFPNLHWRSPWCTRTYLCWVCACGLR